MQKEKPRRFRAGLVVAEGLSQRVNNYHNHVNCVVWRAEFAPHGQRVTQRHGREGVTYHLEWPSAIHVACGAVELADDVVFGHAAINLENIPAP